MSRLDIESTNIKRLRTEISMFVIHHQTVFYASIMFVCVCAVAKEIEEKETVRVRQKH